MSEMEFVERVLSLSPKSIERLAGRRDEYRQAVAKLFALPRVPCLEKAEQLARLRDDYLAWICGALSNPEKDGELTGSTEEQVSQIKKWVGTQSKVPKTVSARRYGSARSLRDPRCPPAGSVLKRTLVSRGGKKHTCVCEVTKDGFLWKGNLYDSPSAVARVFLKTIVGNRGSGRTNGWVFFGLGAAGRGKRPSGSKKTAGGVKFGISARHSLAFAVTSKLLGTQWPAYVSRRSIDELKRRYKPGMKPKDLARLASAALSLRCISKNESKFEAFKKASVRTQRARLTLLGLKPKSEDEHFGLYYKKLTEQVTKKLYEQNKRFEALALEAEKEMKKR